MIGVVTANPNRIRDMTNQLGIDHRNVVVIPARPIDTAASGRILDAPPVDHTATHCDPSDVPPAITASARPVYAPDLPRAGRPYPAPQAPPKAEATLPLSEFEKTAAIGASPCRARLTCRAPFVVGCCRRIGTVRRRTVGVAGGASRPRPSGGSTAPGRVTGARVVRATRAVRGPRTRRGTIGPTTESAPDPACGRNTAEGNRIRSRRRRASRGTERRPAGSARRSCSSSSKESGRKLSRPRDVQSRLPSTRG